MARNDGMDRLCARNQNLKETDIGKVQRHNARENEVYSNPDVVPERACYNVHYKVPTSSYQEMFQQMEKEGIISTRGLKVDADHYCELVFDVNSAYFHNHGGYEFAKKLYEDAYQAAVKIVGGEQYILSAVMHADERNSTMSEALEQDVYHYHLHVVYVPVVEKQILWSKRCKDPALVGTVKETIMQVSRSKKWASLPALDEQGKPILQKNGKPVLRKSYSVLQDDFFNAMQAAGYTDVLRGERGSTEEHLTVTQFKVQQEKQRLVDIQNEKASIAGEVEKLITDKLEAEQAAQDAKEKLKELAPRLAKIETLAQKYSANPDELLPETVALESARTYRDKKAMPLVKRLVGVLRDLYNRYLDAVQSLNKLQQKYDRETGVLNEYILRLKSENEQLQPKAKQYDTLCKSLGQQHMDAVFAAIKMKTHDIGKQKGANREHGTYYL